MQMLQIPKNPGMELELQQFCAAPMRSLRSRRSLSSFCAKSVFIAILRFLIVTNLPLAPRLYLSSRMERQRVCIVYEVFVLGGGGEEHTEERKNESFFTMVGGLLSVLGKVERFVKRGTEHGHFPLISLLFCLFLVLTLM